MIIIMNCYQKRKLRVVVCKLQLDKADSIFTCGQKQPKFIKTATTTTTTTKQT